tara:strand:- start:226 stop:612 length:387 start_codon:yes stop_codon:yes gene_type:complete
MTYKQARKENKITEYVFDIATNDKGMTAKHTVYFHLHNPNGNYKLCREWGNEAYDKGSFVYGIVAGNYEYKKLGELTKLDKPRWRDVRYYVNSLYKDAVQWAEKVKDVENRTDEEIEYFNNFRNKGSK